jgi:hypothetical protein
VSGQTEISQLATELADELLEEHKQLTPEERLELFLNHNRLVAQIQEAGEKKRGENGEQKK